MSRFRRVFIRVNIPLASVRAELVRANQAILLQKDVAGYSWPSFSGFALSATYRFTGAW